MGFHKYEMFKFGYFSSREEDDIVSGIFVFTFENLSLLAEGFYRILDQNLYISTFFDKKSGLLSLGKTNISLV